MKVLSNFKDHRIEAANVLVELTMEEYLSVAGDILNENEFQRKKVINSQISALLVEDILIGCSIPPLVLAVKKALIGNDFDYSKYENNGLVEKAFEQKQLLILDGKQRTHVFSKLYIDLKRKIEKENDVNSQIKLESFLKNILRIEIYVGINKLNILYRMLTLNSGQTSMSTRHLMEMLYLDYLDIPFNGLTLVPDKANEKVSNDTTEYQFKDVLDGFTSYLDKDENTLERSEILDNIKSAKNIKFEDNQKDLFEVFIVTYKKFLDKINTLSAGYRINKDDLPQSEFEVKGLLFGTTAIEIFKRSQAMSGFGAAIAELKDTRDNFGLQTVSQTVDGIKFREDSDYETSIHYLVKHFDNIRDKSKKIGNDQRFYFKYLFKSLFDPDSTYPLYFDKAVEHAYKRTREEKSYLPDLNVS